MCVSGRLFCWIKKRWLICNNGGIRIQKSWTQVQDFFASITNSCSIALRQLSIIGPFLLQFDRPHQEVQSNQFSKVATNGQEIAEHYEYAFIHIGTPFFYNTVILYI